MSFLIDCSKRFNSNQSQLTRGTWCATIYFIPISVMLSLIVWLLIILNPLTTVPAYVSMYPHVSSKQLTRDSLMIAWWALVVLTCAALFGDTILTIFGLEIEYFRIAWWCVIGRVAWNLAQWNLSAITVSEASLHHHKQRKRDSGLIIPLVIPMTSGPGSIAYMISNADSYVTRQLVVAALVGAVVVYIAMRYWSIVIEKLGDMGISVMTRILGIILLAIALQMIIGTILTLI